MKTISAAQLRANRANASKSTGPRTASGKQRASLNALKHGCTAQTVIFPGEDAIHFARFHQSLKDSFAPANAIEESLVENLATTQWALNRMRAHETNLFALGHEQLAEKIDTEGDQAIQSALAGAKILKAEIGTMHLLSLYMQRNARMYNGTLKQLLHLQAARKAAEETELAQAVTVALTHANTNIPFDLTYYGFVSSPARIQMLLRRHRRLNKVPPAVSAAGRSTPALQ